MGNKSYFKCFVLLWVCWFLGKNLSNFVFLAWKFNNPYYHIIAWFTGQTVLDLGCGWGSVALYVAENYPESNVYALSNSSTQKKYIMDQASAKGLQNLTVFTGDVSVFENEEWSEKFDRVISIGKVCYT